MNYSRLFHWMDRKLKISNRLKETAIIYVMFLMVSMRKHSMDAAATFSGSSKSRFSKFLKNHSNLAEIKLDQLSKKQAKRFGKNLRFIADGKLCWKIGILIDSTLQKRSAKAVQSAFGKRQTIQSRSRLCNRPSMDQHRFVHQ